jgi:hypothetical protein
MWEDASSRWRKEASRPVRRSEDILEDYVRAKG